MGGNSTDEAKDASDADMVGRERETVPASMYVCKWVQCTAAPKNDRHVSYIDRSMTSVSIFFGPTGTNGPIL